MTARQDRPDPRFSDDELSRILEQAAGQHVQHGGADGRGYSLREIQQIAAEAGIAPDRVAAAAAQVASRRRDIGPDSPRPGVYQLDHTMPVTLPEGAHVDLVDAMRRATGMPGAVADDMGGTVWMATDDITRWRLVIRSRPAETSVFLESDASDARILTWAGAAVVTLFLSLFAALYLRSVGVEKAYALLAGAAMWGSTAAVAGRVAWRRLSTRMERRAVAVGERITALISGFGGEPEAGSASDELTLPTKES